ncbi:MAG TPA: hypothetical protein VJ777_07900, partial [Mycobacterium sp.]|nr:hypothetical protein [Mycobacterium sp.]
MSARNGWLARFFPPTKSKPMKGPVMMSAGLGRFGRRTVLSLALASIPFFGLNVEKAHALTQYRLRVTPSAQGASSNGYTPTHYVSTTGNATMTQGTYNAAASSSTHCTIAVA